VVGAKDRSRSIGDGSSSSPSLRRVSLSFASFQTKLLIVLGSVPPESPRGVPAIGGCILVTRSNEHHRQ